MDRANGDGEKWIFPRPCWLFLLLPHNENKIKYINC